MATYRFSAQVIGRSGGRSAIAAAAYRSGERIEDERTGLTHDYRARSGVLHTKILAPDAAPEWAHDRAGLWNHAEAGEKRKDAQIARDILLSLPHELNAAQRLELVRGFVRAEWVDLGMVADIAVHAPHREGDNRNHHAHIMLTMRGVTADGFGAKVRDWNSPALLERWREQWAVHQNRALERAGRSERVDHRSLEARGSDHEPEPKQGPVATQMEREGKASKAGDDRRATQARNAERDSIRQELDGIDFVLDQAHFREAGEIGEDARPEPAKSRSADAVMRGNDALSLDTLTAQHSTFTRRDLARLVSRHTDHADEFRDVLAKLEADPQLVRLGRDGQGQPRLTTRSMQAIEQRMDGHAEAMNGRSQHRVGVAMQAGGIKLGDDQKAALHHVLKGPDLSAVIGFAGSGKSTMLDTLRRSYEQAGYRVQGMALSGIAADGLQQGARIDSRTIHSRLFQWDKGTETLTRHDVLVVDEAGMIGSRLMERVLGHARQAGAKVVLVGDVEQLQSIEAGGAMRAIVNRTGAAEISTIRRQKEGWQQQATRELATARTGAALDRYEQAGMVRGHATTDDAKQAMIEGWKQARKDHPAESQIILAFRRDDVRDLNRMAREHRRQAGELGRDHEFQTAQGRASFATGDRVYFLKNDRDMDVRNGSLATIEGIAGDRITVRLDGPDRRLTFSAADYADFAHGYAATIHKSQGVTVDRAHVLASSNLDRHAAYVGMSRHRARLDMHWAKDDIGDRAALTRILSRERLKDTSLDYGNVESGRIDGRPVGGRAGAARPSDAPAKDTAEVRPSWQDGLFSRSVDREKARFEQWANARRAELQSQTHDVESAQGRGHQNEILTLKREQDRAGPERKGQESALVDIAMRQQQHGIGGWIYRLSGQAAKDREQADAITKTIADRTRRHDEQLQVLKNGHEAERRKLAGQHVKQQTQLEQRIDRARARRERDGWRTDHKVAPGRESTANPSSHREAENRPVEAMRDFGADNRGGQSEAAHGPNLEEEEATLRAADAAEEAAQIAAAHAADRERAAQSDEWDKGLEI